VGLAVLGLVGPVEPPALVGPVDLAPADLEDLQDRAGPVALVHLDLEGLAAPLGLEDRADLVGLEGPVGACRALTLRPWSLL
jgi:hypothetical protein